MPINLRRFYLSVLQETKKREEKSSQDASKTGRSPGQLPKGPTVKPGKLSAKGPRVTVPKVRK